LHLNVTRIPCSFPSVHALPGVPIRFRLVPPGPTANTRNVFPALADVKFTSASNRLQLPNGLICPAVVGVVVMMIRFAGFAASWNSTLVIPNVPSGRQKHAPVTIRSCIGSEQSPFDGVTLNTTGALVPRANVHTDVLVNGPNMLLSPDENVVVIVSVPVPPQHASGNAVPGRDASGLNVPLTKLQLTGVTFVNTITASRFPSPFVSHASVAAVVTVLPGRCNGAPVCSSNPCHTVVTSFGKNPQP